MASQGVWSLTRIFFRYMSPIKYIILYDPKSRTISRNTKEEKWFYFQAAITVSSAIIFVYYVLIFDSKYLMDSPSLRAVAIVFGILYASITGLYSVFTISVGFRGDTFYNCFNAVVRTQRQQEGISLSIMQN